MASALHAGDLVGVLESRSPQVRSNPRPQLAVVACIQGSKVKLRLGFDGKEHLIAQRQIELICPLPAGVDPPQRLTISPWGLDAASLAAAAPPRRAWATAWLLLRETGESIPLAAFTDLLCGSVQPLHLAACWLQLMGEQLWFRSRQGQISARPAPELKALRQDRHRQALASRAEQAWTTLLRQRQPLDPSTLPPLQQHWLEQLQQRAAGTLDAEALDPALRRSLNALKIGLDPGDLRHLLVDLGLWNPHQLQSMAGTPWSHGFSAEQLAEAERLLQLAGTTLPADGQRLDLSAQRVLTIDDDDTLDIDDGLALEHSPDGRARIWIHVADPGRLIAADSPLDLEARRRGSSLYLAEGTLPMFPEGLSTGPFSLRAGQQCAAWSIWVELDDAGEIAAYGLQRSWVKPRMRLSYDDADELIDLVPPEEADLAQLERLLETRRQWRLAQGALALDLPEGRIRNRGGSPSLEICEPGPARQLVAEAMILAGAVVARYAVEHQLALPFRSQLPAELPAPAELESLPDGAVRFAAIKRCLSRGLVGTAAAPHFSLGLPAYVQATSPIRRYGDLVAQRQLAALQAQQAPLDPGQLQELLAQFEPAVREGIGISRDDQRHWQQVWFEAHRSGQWQAQFLRWLRPQDRLGLVRIDELAMDLAAHCPSEPRPGSQLLVRVQQVDPLRDLLRLQASAS